MPRFTVDVACLAIQALWGLVLVFVEVAGKTRTAGAAWNAGNRETAPTFPDWVGRAGRALDNHKENFLLFMAAVVTVNLAGKADHTSAIAAMVYVVARAVHGLVYLAGIQKIRTLAFLVGLIATLVIFSRLLFATSYS